MSFIQVYEHGVLPAAERHVKTVPVERPFHVEIISSFEGVTAAAEDWRALEAKANDSFTYFQTYDWCHQWCATYTAAENQKHTSTIKIMVVRRAGQVVAIFPLMITPNRLGKGTLTFLGSPLSQYANILHDEDSLSRDELRGCWNEFLTHLRIDAIVLDKIPHGSSLYAMLDEKELRPSPAGAAYAMNLLVYADFEAYMASLSKSARRCRRKRRNKLANMGELEYRAYPGGCEEYAELIASALNLKTKWLEQNGHRVGELFDEKAFQFLSSLKGEKDCQSGAIASALYLDNKPLAIEIGFGHKSHYYSYNGAFDWQWRDYSVGKVQILETLRWTMESGFATYDLLGNAAAYKSDWSNEQTDLYRYCRIYRASGLVSDDILRLCALPTLKTLFMKTPAPARRFMMSVMSSMKTRLSKPMAK